ncbi:MAG: HEAT repeat domain-containing protein [Promethearchaeota archaeon]
MKEIYKKLQNVKNADKQTRKQILKQFYELLTNAQKKGNPEICANPQLIEPLITCLSDENSEIQTYALASLIMISAASAVEPLIIHLKDANLMIRMLATEALGKLGASRAVEPLILCLKDVDYSIRSKAARSLGLLRNTKAVEDLINCLSDENSEVRIESARALGLIKDPKAFNPLIKSLMDDSQEVQEAVVEAIKLLDINVVDPLIEQLKDNNLELRYHAAWALSKLGNIKAIKPLISYVSDVISNTEENRQMDILKKIIQEIKKFAY